jgi:putative hydrolase of the HAD superfamily
LSLNLKAVAFDLDGTLYPNYRLNVALIPFIFRHGRLLAAFALARDMIRREQEKSRSVHANPNSPPPDFYDYQARLAAKILKAPPDQIKEKIDRLMYTGWPPHFSKVKLFPHVTELLDKLRAAKFKLGLLSDFPPRVKLENLGISGYWDAVFCSEDCGTLKPAARPFQELARALDCPAEQILYVGNSPRYDAAGAKRAGMKTALKTSLFAPGKPGDADFTFNDYRKLRDFMLQ